MEFTSQQKQAITSWRAGDVVVTAGPGSGKTRVLVERIRHLIDAHDVAPERILAITFTVKATHEMDSRLARAKGVSREYRKKFEKVQIQTIDGFCTSLLRENALTAGIDPEFQLLEPTQSGPLLREVITSVLDETFAADPEGTKRFLRAFSGSGASVKEIEPTKVHQQLAALVDTIRSHGAEAIVEEIGESPPIEGLVGDLRSIAESRGDPKLNDIANELATLDPRDDLALAQFLRRVDILNAIGDARANATRELVYRMRDELLPAIRAHVTARLNEDSRRWILSVTTLILSRFERRKHALGAVDFGDLSQLTIRLLEDDAAPKLSYEHILIDEYQDTSPIQEKLIHAVVAAHGKQSPVLFGVGDINQSIYAFRHADPDVFRKEIERVTESGGQSIELAENFRSRPEILAAVKRILPGGPGSGVTDRHLKAAGQHAPKSGPSVEIHIVSAAKKEAVEWEAGRCAYRLADLILQSQGGKSELSWRKCAILLRTQALLTQFASELRRRDVPYRLDAGKGFYAAPEIHEAAAFLRVLRNPRDEISLAAVLKSAFVGIDDDGLLTLKASGLNLADAIATVRIEGPDGVRVRKFQLLLARCRAARETAAPDRILAIAVDECGYENWLLSCEGGSRAAANVHKLMRVLRGLSESFHSFDGVSAALDELLDAAPPESDADEPQRPDDAVQLLTMHAAKGLEFPVVIVAGLQYSRPYSEGPLTFSRERGIGVKWRGPVDGEAIGDPAHRAAAEQMKLRDDAENDRLMYVAATRAEQHLILSCSFSGKPQKQGFCKLLFEPLGINHTEVTNERQTIERDGLTFGLLQVDQPAPVHAAVASGVAPAPPLPLTPREETAREDSSASVSSVAMFAQCPRKYFLSRYIGIEAMAEQTPAPAEGNESSEPVERDNTDATTFGRAVHAYLAEEIDGDQASDAVRSLASAFHDHALGIRAARAHRKWREQSFLFALEERILRGQVDLLFEEGGERVLVDYKTDQLGERGVSEIAADYELQIQLYAAALAKAGQAVDRGVLFFLRAGDPHEVDVEPEALAAARERVSEFFDAQARHDFPLRVARHCKACRHFGGACPAELPTGAEA